MPIARQKIVILGGGYVGLYVAWTLEKHSELPLDVTLIEPRAYMTYQPLLPEVAGGHVSPRDVTVDLVQALPHTTVVRGSVTGARLEGEDGHRRADRRRRDGLRLRPRGRRPRRRDPHVPDAGPRRARRRLQDDRGGGPHQEHRPPQRREGRGHDRSGRAAGSSSPSSSSAAATPAWRRSASSPTCRRRRSPPSRRCEGEEPNWILIEALDRVAPEVGPELSVWTLGELRKRGIDVRLKTTMKSCEDGGREVQRRRPRCRSACSSGPPA